MTELDILLNMKSTICYNRSCENCKLDYTNHPFDNLLSVCTITRMKRLGILTDEVIQYISDYYHELYPDGSVSLPKAEVTEDDINNIFSRS